MKILDFMFGNVVDRMTRRLWKVTGQRPAEAGGRRAVTSPETPDRSPEMAWGGTSIVGGVVYDDPEAEMVGVAAVRKATAMRRGDAQVRAVESVVGLPIRSTVWLLDEPRGAGAAEREATELLRENLFGGMENSWDDLVREGVLAIYYGWRVPEIVWEERAGLVAIRKVASRALELVERWLYDTNGQRVGYLYAGNRPVGLGLEANYSGSVAIFERLPIPIEKCIHFAYAMVDDDPQGFGLWRSMYPHYVTKQALYKVLAMGVERNLLDVPVGKMPRGTQEKTRAKLLSILARWRATEDAAVVLEEGQSLEFMGSNRALFDAMPLVQHHNTMLAQVALAQFLNLGQQSAGTHALGAVQPRLFEIAEDANARWIAPGAADKGVRAVQDPRDERAVREVPGSEPAACQTAVRDGRALQPAAAAGGGGELARCAGLCHLGEGGAAEGGAAEGGAVGVRGAGAEGVPVSLGGAEARREPGSI